VELLCRAEEHRALRRTAEGVRLLQDGIEYRREVAGRRIDDPQDLGGRGLLSARFGKFGFAFVEPAPQFGSLAFAGGFSVVAHARHAPPCSLFSRSSLIILPGTMHHH
jgi:hypothetical protein